MTPDETTSQASWSFLDFLTDINTMSIRSVCMSGEMCHAVSIVQALSRRLIFEFVIVTRGDTVGFVILGDPQDWHSRITVGFHCTSLYCL